MQHANLPSTQCKVKGQQDLLAGRQLEFHDQSKRRQEDDHVQNEVEGRVEEAEVAEADAFASCCCCRVPQRFKRTALEAADQDNGDGIETVDQANEGDPVLEVLLRKDGDVQGENAPLDEGGGHAIEDRVQGIKLPGTRLCQRQLLLQQALWGFWVGVQLPACACQPSRW